MTPVNLTPAEINLLLIALESAATNDPKAQAIYYKLCRALHEPIATADKIDLSEQWGRAMGLKSDRK